MRFQSFVFLFYFLICYSSIFDITLQIFYMILEFLFNKWFSAIYTLFCLGALNRIQMNLFLLNFLKLNDISQFKLLTLTFHLYILSSFLFIWSWHRLCIICLIILGVEINRCLDFRKYAFYLFFSLNHVHLIWSF